MRLHGEDKRGVTMKWQMTKIEKDYASAILRDAMLKYANVRIRVNAIEELTIPEKDTLIKNAQDDAVDAFFNGLYRSNLMVLMEKD